MNVHVNEYILILKKTQKCTKHCNFIPVISLITHKWLTDRHHQFD